MWYLSQLAASYAALVYMCMTCFFFALCRFVTVFCSVDAYLHMQYTLLFRNVIVRLKFCASKFLTSKREWSIVHLDALLLRFAVVMIGWHSYKLI